MRGGGANRQCKQKAGKARAGEASVPYGSDRWPPQRKKARDTRGKKAPHLVSVAAPVLGREYDRVLGKPLRAIPCIRFVNRGSSEFHVCANTLAHIREQTTWRRVTGGQLILSESRM